jgi:hypothetical protein
LLDLTVFDFLGDRENLFFFIESFIASVDGNGSEFDISAIENGFIDSPNAS